MQGGYTHHAINTPGNTLANEVAGKQSLLSPGQTAKDCLNIGKAVGGSRSDYFQYVSLQSNQLNGTWLWPNKGLQKHESQGTGKTRFDVV